MSAVRRWLHGVGLKLLVGCNVCYRGPAVSSESWRRKRYQEVLGSTLFPLMSGIYMLGAVKSKLPMTPLREVTKLPKDQSCPGYAEPSITERAD